MPPISSIDVLPSDLPRVIAQERRDEIDSRAKIGAGEAESALPSSHPESGSTLPARESKLEISGSATPGATPEQK